MTILGIVVGVGALGLGLTAAKRGYGTLEKVVDGCFDKIDGAVSKVFGG